MQKEKAQHNNKKTDTKLRHNNSAIASKKTNIII